MRGRVLWLELLLVSLALVFAETGAVLNELRTAVVSDWFVSLAPLIWINACLLVLYAFFRLYRGASPALSSSPASARTNAWRFLTPNFRSVREAAREKLFRRLWAAAGLAYGIAYSLLQGIIVVDPSGSIVPVSTVLESPIGYGPGFAWAPTDTFGIQIRPFFVAAAFALSFFSGLVIALSVRPFAARRRAAVALPGPLLGFAVMCPACVVAPVTGLYLAYAAPFAAMGGMGAATFSHVLVISTALLVFTLVLLWIVISLLSNVWLPALPAGENPQTRT